MPMTDLFPSVTGDVAAGELRWLYPHEHLLVSWNEFKGETVYPGNTEYARRQITAMLIELKDLGVDALIDATPIGIGRDEAYVEFARGVSAASGVRVFLSTGLYVPAHWPPWAREWSATQLGDLFTRETPECAPACSRRPSAPRSQRKTRRPSRPAPSPTGEPARPCRSTPSALAENSWTYSPGRAWTPRASTSPMWT